MSFAHSERADFAAFLATLTPAQWEEPTLCAGWSVRDVVAHALSYEELSLPTLFGRLTRAGLSLRRANEAGLAAYRHRSPGELLALLRNHLDPHGLTAAFGGRIALLDAMIHQQDIRRPLGMPRRIPGDRLRTALGFAMIAPPIGARRRTRGLHLVATDCGWSTGHGPEVEGPGEALLMAIAGRTAALPELAGPGVITLTGRTNPAP